MRNSSKTFVYFLTLTVIGQIFCASVSAQNGTTANGIITKDTLWSKANSPYTLTGPVAIAEGITLTIEPGVTIQLNNYYIQVNGTLTAKGTKTDNIIFMNGNGAITFNPSSSAWSEQTQTGCIMENAVVGCYVYIYSSPKIFNDTINCGVFVKQGTPIITHNTISDFYYGLSIDGDCTGGTVAVTDNIFSGIGDVGIYISNENAVNLIIQRNLLIDCSQGAIMVCYNATISDNTIINNKNEGIIIKTPFATITNNNIQNNHPNLSNWGPSNISVPNNWWGTTDQQAINQTIHDNKNDFNLGTVNFVPFLTSPNLQAPSLNTPTPTPSITITPSSSSALTESPTANPTQTSASTVSPSIPEFPAIVLLPLVLLVFSVAAVLRHRKPQPQL